MKFINIDVKSCYTKDFDSTVRIKDLIKMAKEQGQEYVFISDEKMMNGYVEFIKMAREANLKPIVGLTLETNYENHKFKITMYPKNEIGFKKEIALSSKINIQEKLTIQEILRNLSDVIVVFEFMGKDKKKQMIENVINLVDRSKVDVYMGIRINQDTQKERAKRLNNSAKELRIPTVALQNVKFWKGQESLVEIMQDISGVHKENRISNCYRFEEEIFELFEGFEDAVVNTMKIAQKCYTDYVLRGHAKFKDLNAKFKIPTDYKAKDMKGKYVEFEKYPVEMTEQRERMISYFVETVLSNEKIPEYIEKYGEEKVMSRIQYEMGVIIAKGYENYFLVVQDFINYAKKEGVHAGRMGVKIPIGPGRGSSAASFVAFLMNIVEQINAIEEDFMFERFLNIDVDTHDPDIDIDISTLHRGKLFSYAQERYGKERVAKVATFGRYAGKSNIRDLGKRMDISENILTEINSLIGKNGINELKKHPKEIKKIMEEEPKVRRLIQMAFQVEGLPKNQSIHAAGIVVSEEDIREILPVYVVYDKDEEQDIYVIQLDKDMLGEVGLNKIDFLSLKNLDAMESTIEKIRTKYDPSFDIKKIPKNDSKTFKLFEEKELTGIFQMESDGMRRAASQIKPKELQDIFHLIAIYRPGALKMIPKYVENIMNNVDTVWGMNENDKGYNEVDFVEIKEGEEILKPILNKTKGIILYQEQIMRILGAWANYTPSEADVFRRVISKKDAEKMNQMKNELLERSKKAGRDEKTSNTIIDLILQFGRYGFNEPHSGAYGLLVYQMAYLKAHYPLEYMSSLLNVSFEKTERVGALIQDVFDMGFVVKKPSVLNPTVEFETMNDTEISYGIGMLRGMSLKTAQHIWEVHEKKPFSSFNDFVRRTSKTIVDKSKIEILIDSGFFDEFGTRFEIRKLNEEIIGKYATYEDLILLEELSFLGSDYDDDEVLSGEKEYPTEEKNKKEKFVTYYLFKNKKTTENLNKIKNVNEEVRKQTKNVIFVKINEIVIKEDKNKNEMAFMNVDDGNGRELKLTVFAYRWKELKGKVEEKDFAYLTMDEKKKNVVNQIVKYNIENILEVVFTSKERFEEISRLVARQDLKKGFDKIKLKFDKEEREFSVVLSKRLTSEFKKHLSEKEEINLTKVQL